MKALTAALVVFLSTSSIAAAAGQPVRCAGVALMGAAQLACSHVDKKAPSQFCNFSWALHSDTDGARIEEGSFLIAPGAQNIMVYQGNGFDRALSDPVVMCHGRGKKG
jgi:hypothetical protein